MGKGSQHRTPHKTLGSVQGPLSHVCEESKMLIFHAPPTRLLQLTYTGTGRQTDARPHVRQDTKTQKATRRVSLLSRKLQNVSTLASAIQSCRDVQEKPKLGTPLAVRGRSLSSCLYF